MLIPHRWPGTPLPAVLVARPNRFLALCKMGRKTVEAHVPDRGRCLDLLVPGQPLTVVEARGAERRTGHTVLLARSIASPRTWVSLDPAGAPRLVVEALRRGLLPSLAGLVAVRREIPLRDSRIDLLLSQDVLCEVKSVGAARDGVALFPDAPTLRGVRHLGLLARLSRRGRRCALVFCAQRGDVRAVAPDTHIDPAFAIALRAARRAGVQVVALRCSAHPRGMDLMDEIPVLL
jgi:sugar fermentation stimulation protein A